MYFSSELTAIRKNLTRYSMGCSLSILLLTGVLGCKLVSTIIPATDNTNISISSMDYRKRNLHTKKNFTRYEGKKFGMKGNTFTSLDFKEPAKDGRGIASGDFNNDNWQDIVLAANTGILLYKNTGEKRFALQDIPAVASNTLDVFGVAFVDINNDGWQDIFVASYGGENLFLLNDGGDFTSKGILNIPHTNKIILTMAVSFADLNRDGYLDFFMGNWSFGGEKTFNSKFSGNRLYINHNLNFQPKDIKELSGETLSVLFTDFNNDNAADLLVGNDVWIPDMYYMGDADGNLTRIEVEDGIIPLTTENNMSFDTGDFNNDLLLDIFSSDMNFAESESIDYCSAILEDEERTRCKQNFIIQDIILNRGIADCVGLHKSDEKNNCMVAIWRNMAINSRESKLCDRIPAIYKTQRELCRNLSLKGSPDDRPDLFEYSYSYIEQKKRNVLLVGSENRNFNEQAVQMGVDESFWSWNAKFADLDNDEWQDIYVGNGSFYKDEIHSNIFYHNLQGKKFAIQQKEFGLEDFIHTPSYTYVDIDNDGDLDIIATGINAPLRIFVNNEYKNNLISFEFRDRRGNRFGIGSKIIIYYGKNSKRRQLREVKSGGGFLSFDAPIAYFGLAEYTQVNRIEIVWSTGEKNRINKILLANKRYIIVRE